jgi:hypothetical protein
MTHEVFRKLKFLHILPNRFFCATFFEETTLPFIGSATHPHFAAVGVSLLPWTRSTICYFGNKGLGFLILYLDLVVDVVGVLGRANVRFLTAARAILRTSLDCCLSATGCSYGGYSSRSVEVSSRLS